MNHSVIEEILSNRDQGASALLDKFTIALPELNRKSLSLVLGQLQATFPSMAVWWFAEKYFHDLELNPETIARFIVQIKAEKSHSIQRGLDHTATHRTLLTLSRSSLVEAFLLARNDKGAIRVICSRSLPAQEGIKLQHNLLANDIHTDLVEDWELKDQVPASDALILGADWITESTIINKWGSSEIIDAAYNSKKPIYVLAEKFKQVDGFNFQEQAYFQSWASGYVCRRVKVFEPISRTQQIQLL